jgi:ppGpp synthetase/RelA/SpoT-type nucleotidyltranferase
LVQQRVHRDLIVLARLADRGGTALVSVADRHEDELVGVSDPPVPSKSQVNRAGDLLARAQLGAVDLTADERLGAMGIVDAWRQSHAVPLEWVTNALGRRIGPIATQCVVAQRLKRMPQIVKKLARYGNMNLARMQDLGGCRIVLPDLEQIDEAARLIGNYGTDRWEIRHRADYRIEGRPDTAYRALHIIVSREHRMVEIQLRTLREHAWAEAVERVTALSDHDVKEGRAPQEFLEYFKLASDAFYALDNERDVSKRHRHRFRELHAHLGRYVLGHG